MKCVVKIMATTGTRAAIADLCMFGLAACDDGGPGFVNASMRTITNSRQVGVRLQSKCTGTHRHARVNADNPIEEGEQTGSWVRQVAQAMEEQLKEDQQELETREKKRKVEDVQRTRRMVHDSDKNKILSHMQTKWADSGIMMSRSFSACGMVGIGMTTKGGGLIQSCAPKRDKKKWSTFVATRCTRESPGKCAYARPEGHPSRQDGRRVTRGSQESPTCA